MLSEALLGCPGVRGKRNWEQDGLYRAEAKFRGPFRKELLDGSVQTSCGYWQSWYQ